MTTAEDIRQSFPYLQNSCAGNFKDWLEVYLTSECNGRCAWCIEKGGYKPEESVHWLDLVNAISRTGRKYISLLGGEPTLYPDLELLINTLNFRGLKVYLTTNGSLLTAKFVKRYLYGLTGINISIHHFDLERNEQITGVNVNYKTLKQAVRMLQSMGVGITVRFNCNVIKGEIDTLEKLGNYITWAHDMGVNSVRFAELKDDGKNFVSLYKLCGGSYNLNEDPYVFGCHQETTILGMPVSFRQMCGLQTPCRCKPFNPQQIINPVMYYDGKLYNGWQKAIDWKEEDMSKKPQVNYDVELVDILTAVSKGTSLVATAALQIDRMYREKTVSTVEAALGAIKSGYKNDGSGCSY